ncbi:phage tail protein [Listeria booriae]|uniref:phage tail protein n=1 Tax=Listeria booriae TaxID=1552123 RepID=UPI001627FA8A|nr:phage tail protein [Listeria booriae]MBC2163412.1 hypothetical protein [Listeria booriae]
MLLPFREPSGAVHLAQAEITRKHGVNGEKSLTGVIQITSDVITRIDKRWSLVFDNETYVIDYTNQIDEGNNKSLVFDAVHEFFDRFNKKTLNTETSGSNTFKWYLDKLFAGTGYSYNLATTVDALEKENWGMQNRMALFADLINDTGLEYKVDGKIVTITDKIGTDLSTIVRKGFNMQDFSVESDFSNFITYMEGFGAYVDSDDPSKGRLHVTYTSPLAEVYGILEGDPKSDERFTIKANLESSIKSIVDNSIAISLQLTLEDLQSAGYPYAMAQSGDYIMVINELMDFQQKVRIVEVEDSFDINGEKLGVVVTCGSINMANKQQASDAANGNLLDRIINGDERIPPSWLTDFILENTEALNNARSELKFTEQGIIAVDKNDSNKLVVFNSAGLGVSTDGGKTYGNAITALGINASAIVTGILKSINIEGVTIRGSAGYFDTLYSSYMPPLPAPQYEEILKIGGGDGFSLEAKRRTKPYPALRVRLNTNGDLGMAIEYVNEDSGVVNPDRVIRLSPLAGVETPLVYSTSWFSAGCSPGGKVASIISSSWGTPTLVYADHVAKSYTQTSSILIKQDVEKFSDSRMIEKYTAKQMIGTVEVFCYRLRQDVESAFDEEEKGGYVSFDKRIGFIAELLPPELRSDDMMAMDMQKTIMWLWLAAQENFAEVDHVRRELEETKEILSATVKIIDEQSQEIAELKKMFQSLRDKEAEE